MAVTTQLDLQSRQTAPGRCAPRHQGWDDRRRLVQETVSPGLPSVMALLAAGLWQLIRGTLACKGATLPGLVPVRGFVGIRAVGFRHADTGITPDVMHLRPNRQSERTGPVLIGLAGLCLLLRWSAKAPDPETPG